MATKIYTSVFNPYQDIVYSAALKTRSIEIARDLRMNGVRYDNLPEVFAATRGGAYDFTYLDQMTNVAIAAGLEVSLVLAYVPTGGGWISSSKLVSAADIPYLVAANVASVQRVLDLGLPRTKLTLEMWNEPDLTSFGAPVNGTWHRANIAFFNACASAMKANFPDIRLFSPSIGYLSGSLTWDSITDANCGVNGVVDSHWQYYDGFNVHIYPNIGDKRPAGTLADIKKVVNVAFQNLMTTIASTSLISGYFVGAPIIVSEFGFDFNNAGMNQSSTRWSWGNEKMRARYLMKALTAISMFTVVERVSIYNAMNTAVAHDSRNNVQHYGICDSAGNPYELYVQLAVLSGQTVTSSTVNSTGVVDPL